MIEYLKEWLPKKEAASLFDTILQLPLEQRFLTIFEKTMMMPRLTAWMSDSNLGYQYSGQTTPVIPWDNSILDIRKRLEDLTESNLASVLINHYRNGKDYVSYHTDSPEHFGPNPKIVSLSLGATRTFKLRRSDRTRNPSHTISYELGDGDVIILDKEHVNAFQHSIPKTARAIGPRTNLTFRSIN